ncbi:DUF4235 domain-containing protein [Arthrobacter sp. UM1]|uniref:DUF4235 domain-containing protein n=1 Tax=Arthrobacter sp. UM1 TaxID=2766776 RepID=UPI001CF6AFE7|nr:DUF4235 domain-containing protein [Arthrobacter sp. UM1]MCB4208454.1 DUF4235 domain-containing protein [Arthrobacter sp. UM1]
METIIKLIGTGASIGAGFASTKLVNVIWEKTTGNRAPKKGQDAEQSFVQAVTFAVVSAAVTAVFTQLVRRGEAKAIRTFNKSQKEVS